MKENDIRFYEFGGFRLDTRRRTLLKNGERVQLTPRNFDLLLVLIQNEGRILEHDELLEKVWEGTFVEQSNLKKGISALRQILDETPNESLYIKTVPRRGYSFVADVKPVSDSEELLASEQSLDTEIELNIEEISAAETVDTKQENEIKPITERKQAKSTFPAAFRQRSFITVVLILFTSLLLALIGWKLFAAKTSAIDLSRMQIHPLTNLGNATYGMISRNNEYLVFVTQESGLIALWQKHLKTGKITQLLKPRKNHIYALDVAPLDESIYFWLMDYDNPSRNGVYKISLFGGEPQKVTDKSWAGLNFSPDGKQIVYIRRNINEQGDTALFVANPDGSDEKLIFNTSTAGIILQNIGWSPDGRFITYVALSNRNNQKLYYIAQIPSTGGNEQIILPPRAEEIFSAAWFPDGKGLAVTAIDTNSMLMQVWYFSYPGGEWRRITNDSTNYGYARITSDGKDIFIIQQRDMFQLWTGQIDGQNFRPITSDTVSYHNRCGWLDEKTILFAAKTGDNYEIWTMNEEDANRRQLTFDAKNDLSPVVSPDGKRILFLSNRSGTYQVWQMDADGSNPLQITDSPSEIRSFRILPDGQTIIYSLWLPGQNTVLFKKTIGETDSTQLKVSEPIGWDISPDGKTIAYASQTKNGIKIYLTPLEENKPTGGFDFGNFDNFIWTKDGKALLYDSFNNNHDEIMMQPVEGGAPKPLTNFNSEDNIWNFNVSPGGSRIIARRVKQYFDVMLIKLNSE